MSETFHLERRNGVYYYRRRVPDHAVKSVGARTIKYSLGTSDKKEARKRREFEDLKWSASFEQIARDPSTATEAIAPTAMNAETTLDVLRDYVARLERKARTHPATELDRDELRERKIEAEQQVALLRDPADPRAAEQVFRAVQNLLTPDRSVQKAATSPPEVDELVRRALLELSRRQLARLDDDFTRPFFDHLFDPAAPKRTTFGELATQYLGEASQDAAANGISAKRADKVRANVALIREIVGDSTPVSAIDYDACQRVRRMLSQTPTNRTKVYPKLTLDRDSQSRSSREASAVSHHPRPVFGDLQRHSRARCAKTAVAEQPRSNAPAH